MPIQNRSPDESRITLLTQQFFHVSVRERLGDNEQSTDISVQHDGLISVRWPSGRRSDYSADELEILPSARIAKVFAETMAGDPFSKIRGLLPHFQDKEQNYGCEET